MGDLPNVTIPLGLQRNRWYNEILEGLEDVTRVDGTAAGLPNPLAGAGEPRSRFFAKTGTLNSRSSRLFRIVTDTIVENRRFRINQRREEISVPGIAIKTLSFAVGISSKQETSPLRCGIVGSIYFKMRSDVKTSVPEYAQSFARNELWPIINENWRRLDVCPRPMARSR